MLHFWLLHPKPFTKCFFLPSAYIHTLYQFFCFPMWSIIGQFFFHKNCVLTSSLYVGTQTEQPSEIMEQCYVQWHHDIQPFTESSYKVLAKHMGFFAGHLNATPAIIFHLMFPQFPELGRVDRGVGEVLEGNGVEWGWTKMPGDLYQGPSFIPLLL